jgi:hypothetical protein
MGEREHTGEQLPRPALWESIGMRDWARARPRCGRPRRTRSSRSSARHRRTHGDARARLDTESARERSSSRLVSPRNNCFLARASRSLSPRSAPHLAEHRRGHLHLGRHGALSRRWGAPAARRAVWPRARERGRLVLGLVCCARRVGRAGALLCAARGSQGDWCCDVSVWDVRGRTALRRPDSLFMSAARACTARTAPASLRARVRPQLSCTPAIQKTRIKNNTHTQTPTPQPETNAS